MPLLQNNPNKYNKQEESRYLDFLYTKKASLQAAQNSLNSLSQRRQTTESSVLVAKEALDIVNHVLMYTQTEVKQCIESIVSSALTSVYGEEYGFEIDFVVKRNQTEAVFNYIKNGIKMPLEDSTGGGFEDIVSMSLRLAFYVLSSNRTTPIMILDEPTKQLSSGLQEAFGSLLQSLSREMGIQIILVTHSKEIIKYCDKAYLVTMSDKIHSEVIEIDPKGNLAEFKDLK